MSTSPTNSVPALFGRDGRPLTLRRFVDLRADAAYRSVARETVGEHEVITSWLGIDQSDGREGRPAIFGTIARHLPTGRWLEDREQFAVDEEAARANHVSLVRSLTA